MVFPWRWGARRAEGLNGAARRTGSVGPWMPGSVMLSVLLAGLALAAAQKPTEIKQSDLKNLIKPTEGADLAKSFRCGVFYVDPNEPLPEDGGRPAHPLLIFNATWDAADECPGGNYDRYETFCNSIVSRPE